MTKMHLETQRLILRSFEASDAQDLYDYLSRENVVRFEPYPPFSFEEAQTEARRRATDPDFIAVCLKSEKVIGNLYLAKRDFGNMELGYVFHEAFWGKGYAFESAQALIDFAFGQSGARRITAECNPLNVSSWKLLERLGFRREGELIRNVAFKSDAQGQPLWQNTYVYGLLKEEWIQRRS